MNAAELDALLRQFLVDGKLSGTERQVLQSWVHRNLDTEPRRAVARSQVFDAARRAANSGNAVELITFLEDVMKVLSSVPLQPAK